MQVLWEVTVVVFGLYIVGLCVGIVVYNQPSIDEFFVGWSMGRFNYEIQPIDLYRHWFIGTGIIFLNSKSIL